MPRLEADAMRRYARLLWLSVRASVMVSLQYRLEFVVEGLSSVLMAALTFVPLMVVYGRRASVGGWSYGESLVVLGFFVLLKTVIEGAVNPSLLRVVEQVRQGTLDFVLLKPADSQFLVSTTKFDASALPGLVASAAIFGWAFGLIGSTPSIGGILLGLMLVICSVVLIYSLWLLVVASAIRLVRVDNLVYLFTALFDIARWPSSVFRGAWSLVFTFVLPLGIMTTWPAAALLNRLTAGSIVAGVSTTIVFAVLARRLWQSALRRYTSASS